MYIKVKKSIGLLVCIMFFTACEKNKQTVSLSETTVEMTAPTGVRTISFNSEKFKKVIYVDVLSESKLEKGSKKAPYKSVSKALVDANNNTAILIAKGDYIESTIELKKGVSLFGGFDGLDWSRDVQLNQTVLTGSGEQRILISADDTTIDGFVFSRGKYRGAGAAIFCKNTSPLITNNVFDENTALGPLNWNPEFWHETAHDGGAIYGENGASPIIKNNIFFNNRTENGRGAAIAFDNKCKVVINNNVFVDNIAGTNDPMRSSDGGGISIFDWCDAEILDNIFVGNKALARNDGGGVFVALWSSARVNNNILVDSESGDDAGALFVAGQEHRYGGAPFDPLPPKNQFYVTVDNNQFYGNRNSSMNSGAMRFTMESRGEFTNNRLAFNNGVYFQRSEVTVKNNMILDNFLFIETKEGLKQGSIENNVIWGDFELTTPAKVSGNIIKDGYDGGANNKKGTPKLKEDGMSHDIMSSTIKRRKLKTELMLSSANYKENELVNRTVRSGDKWGVIQSNTSSTITVWGNLANVASIQILPSYTKVNKKVSN